MLNVAMIYSQNFPINAQAAVNRAVATWSAALNSNQQIRIDARWDIPLPGDRIAMCVPNAIENFNGAPVANTWYTSALADKIAQVDLQPNNPDMVVFFNSQDYTFNTNQNACPGDQIDLQTNALHEICHGLGFIGAFWVETYANPQMGSFGSPNVIGALPGNLNYPFVLPALNSHPTAFGRFVQEHGNNDTLITTYANPSNQLAQAIQSGDLRFQLPNNATRGIYAPANFAPFSSGDHFTVPPVSLMKYDLAPEQRIHVIDPPVIDALVQTGW